MAARPPRRRGRSGAGAEGRLTTAGGFGPGPIGRSGAASLPCLLLGCACLLTACGSDPVDGRCTHTFEDPVVGIREVRGLGGEAIPELKVWSIELDGAPVAVSSLLAPPAFRIAAIGDTLVCEAECGFGTAEGVYQFTVQAVGYERYVIEVDAAYATFDGGCPSSNADGARLDVLLYPDD